MTTVTKPIPKPPILVKDKIEMINNKKLNIMEYTVDYFIRKFEAIPEERWITHCLVNHENTKRCALGHCCPDYSGRYFNNGRGQTEESEALIKLFGRNHLSIGGVNDGNSYNYQQDTPKQRILSALKDIKKKLSNEQSVQASVATEDDSSTLAGTTMYSDITKELAVLPEDKKEVDLFETLTPDNKQKTNL